MLASASISPFAKVVKLAPTRRGGPTKSKSNLKLRSVRPNTP